jgi:holo-[acyl-carrier protein] synthase
MSIIGTGVDLVDIARIRRACTAHARFVMRIFTEQERRETLEPQPRYERLAGRFAVKEAVSKALGCGIGPISFLEIETVNNSQGAPEVRLYGAAQEKAQALGVRHIHVTISHEKTMAVAMIILEG